MSETNNPNAGDSSKGENLQGVGHLIASETAMATEEKEGDTSLTRTSEIKEVGEVIYGHDVLKSILQEDEGEEVQGEECVRENPLILPKGEFRQDAAQTESYYLGPPDPMSDIDWEEEREAINCDLKDTEFCKREAPPVNVDAGEEEKCLIGVFPDTDSEHFLIPTSINIEDIRKRGMGLLSVFEKNCPSWKKFVNMKVSDLLAKTEESYLTVSNSNVKRVDILNPDYNLSSNDYEPMVGIVGKRYQIVIDVSLFCTERIVVHVVNDRVNVYARQQHEDKEGCESVEFHKVYQVPETANKDGFLAHMLNPLKLLCICAPVELSEQGKETGTETDT